MPRDPRNSAGCLFDNSESNVEDNCVRRDSMLSLAAWRLECVSTVRSSYM